MVLATAAALLGAIRWDAWYWANPDVFVANRDIVGRTVTLDLQPEQFRFRAPYFSETTPNGTLVVGLGNSSQVMAAELQQAQSAGIRFFAYCTYPIECREAHPSPASCEPKIQGCCADNSALSYALKLHLAVPNPPVNISLILQAHWFADPESYGNAESMQEQVDRYASYFARPSYQRVAGGRPLVYMLGGTASQLAPGLAALRKASVAAGAGDPYIVFMGSTDMAASWGAAKAMGMQAVSTYNTVKQHQAAGSSYAENMAFSRQVWEAGAKAGAPVVPTVSAGWDPRPRELANMPWGNVSCALGPGRCFMTDPTMPQLTQATRDALSFAASAEPGVALISAWNEYDEGHWIAPSAVQGDAKLRAVAAATGAGG